MLRDLIRLPKPWVAKIAPMALMGLLGILGSALIAFAAYAGWNARKFPKDERSRLQTEATVLALAGAMLWFLALALTAIDADLSWPAKGILVLLIALGIFVMKFKRKARP